MRYMRYMRCMRCMPTEGFFLVLFTKEITMEPKFPWAMLSFWVELTLLIWTVTVTLTHSM